MKKKLRRHIWCCGCRCTYWLDQAETKGEFRNKYVSGEGEIKVRWVCLDCLYGDNPDEPEMISHNTTLLIEECSEASAATILAIEQGEVLACQHIPSVLPHQKPGDGAIRWMYEHRLEVTESDRPNGDKVTRWEDVKGAVAAIKRLPVVKGNIVWPADVVEYMNAKKAVQREEMVEDDYESNWKSVEETKSEALKEEPPKDWRSNFRSVFSDPYWWRGV